MIYIVKDINHIKEKVNKLKLFRINGTNIIISNDIYIEDKYIEIFINSIIDIYKNDLNIKYKKVYKLTNGGYLLAMEVYNKK